MVNIKSISNGLKLGDNGIWISKNTEPISYPSDGNEISFFIEDKSFWFKHRNNCIVSIINAYPPPNNETIFDIGGGNGFVSRGLVNSGFDVVLVDPSITGSLRAKSRGITKIICATANTATFKQHSLPAVGLFDVIEHIENDLDLLKSIKGLMKNEGYLYVTVPSYPFLWSKKDDVAGHYRRYTLKNISDVLKSAGFRVVFSSYIFRFLPIFVFLLRTLPYRLGIIKGERKNDNISGGHIFKGAITEKILNMILQPEIKNLKNKKPMMFGSSCLLVAKTL